ncbi:uncharacterized protein [Neodiprion pinetum]|uniref:uncharacterized protein isoform X1 n=1 Tax=Neodiprion pinetum TaxID=441929 RepID=UPI0037209017
MDDSDLLLISSVYLGAILVNRRRERIRRRRRRLWVRPINMRRRQQGAFHNLFQELKTDPQMFWKYARMTLPSFQNLLDIANPSLLKRSPRAINPEQRLALTLRFLSGDKVPAIAFAYRVGLSTVHKIIKETSDALGRVLGHRYLQAPSKEEYLQIAEGFWQLWNFPHCLGAIDGKHVDAQCPPNSGTLYFNYHKRYSVVLMAVCDHNYKFTLVDIGSAGKNSDGGIFAISDLNPENRQLNIPEGASKLSGSDIQMPYFFIGDEAFPIGQHLMRPFTGNYLGERKNIFNYRLSRARRIIENSFGILAKKWAIYNRPIVAIPENINKYILTTVCLHNYIRHQEGDNIQFQNNDEVIENIENGIAYAVNVRETLSNYFLTPPGMVNWQYDYVTRGQNLD